MTRRTGDRSGGQDHQIRHQLAGAALAVAVRPRLWGVAVTQVLRLAAPGWWRRWPPLPLPDRDYLRFRMQTAYGNPDAPLERGDVVAYLEWCRRFPS